MVCVLRGRGYDYAAVVRDGEGCCRLLGLQQPWTISRCCWEPRWVDCVVHWLLCRHTEAHLHDVKEIYTDVSEQRTALNIYIRYPSKTSVSSHNSAQQYYPTHKHRQVRTGISFRKSRQTVTIACIRTDQKWSANSITFRASTTRKNFKQNHNRCQWSNTRVW